MKVLGTGLFRCPALAHCQCGWYPRKASSLEVEMSDYGSQSADFFFPPRALEAVKTAQIYSGGKQIFNENIKIK